MHFLAITLLGALMLLIISVQRTYGQIPLKELKRRAQNDDELAKLLYRAGSYGSSLSTILKLLVIISSAAFLLLVARWIAVWPALIISVLMIWLGFVWLPTARASQVSQWLAAKIAAPLSWLLSYLHPLITRLNLFFRRHRPVTIHTGLYQKEDILQLIDQQQVQSDNRITDEELKIVTHALTYGDKTIRSVMTPRRVIKMVSAEDTVGPVFMTELHDTGHSRFPVYGEDKDTIVGTLYVKDLVLAKTGGRVSDVMRPEVYYVNEEATLDHALQAFLKTKHHLFMVVNEFEEIVGVITIEDVLEQILGRKILDEFDRYDDLRAVAKLHAKEARDDQVGEVIE